MWVAAAFRSMPAGRCRGPLADVLDCERCDSFSQPVIRWEHAVVAMPVLPRRRHEIGVPVEELKRREFDAAARARPRGLPPTAGPGPVNGFVSRQHVANAVDAAVSAADRGEPLECKERAGAVPQQVFQGMTIDTQLEPKERDLDEKRRSKTCCSPRRACRRRQRRRSGETV